MQVAILEGLVRYKLGTFEIEPALATSWKSSADGLAWTFYLRHGVQFHHGYGEFKASDVVFTLDRRLDPEYKGTMFVTHFAPVQKVEAVDDYTVRITLSAPSPIFLHTLAGFTGYILSEKAFREKGASEFGHSPVATGPYMFDSWIPSQKVVLVPNDQYWGPKPRLDRVEYVPILEEATVYNAFEARDLDMIIPFMPEKVVMYREDPTKEVYSVPGLATTHLGINAAFRPQDDIRIREAICYAINNDAIQEGLWKGTRTIATGIWPPFAEHALVDYWHPVYDPEKAKELLAEAGYPNGFDTVIYAVAGASRSLGPAIIVQENLRAVGINAKIEQLEIAAFIGKLRKGEAPMWVISMGLDPVPDKRINAQFDSANWPGSNWSKFIDLEVDKWLAQANASQDWDVRDELFKKVQQRVMDSYEYYLMDWETFHIAVWSYVKGFVPDTQRTIRLDNVYIEH
jgi:peptide/nickel transport system substrate-binding protein